MWRGEVLELWVAEEAGAPMRAREAVQAVAGRGIDGDRYFKGNGFYSWFTGPLREISLIEIETIDALARDAQIVLPPGAHRRNVVTRGVPLNHLVGETFRVGDAILRGVTLCEPCGHVVQVTGIRGLMGALLHRGGLHAEIVSTGGIAVGDAVGPEVGT